MPERTRVLTGLDVLVASRFATIRGCRVGAICNPASIDARTHHLVDLLDEAEGIELRALFGPEHGVRAEAQDMVDVGSEVDLRTGLLVHSLYGSDADSLRPSSSMLDGLDALVFDLQDVGSRYYTFAATMLFAMQAASTCGLRFVVLDRPNPIGGVRIEGPTVREGFSSFVGVHPVPIRHGLTVGELARLFQNELDIPLDLEVVACEGWERSMPWRETGLPWVMPSPNMPTPETAEVYPGACLIEGTNLSEGRGTTRPFEFWGAPWLDPHRLASSTIQTPGVRLRPCSYRPMFHKHVGEVCRGVQPHVTDSSTFCPVAVFTDLIAKARLQAPERFAWRTEPYEFVSAPIAIDLLYGSDHERRAIETGVPTLELVESWIPVEEDFAARRQPFLLYRELQPAVSSRRWLDHFHRSSR